MEFVPPCLPQIFSVKSKRSFRAPQKLTLQNMGGREVQDRPSLRQKLLPEEDLAPHPQSLPLKPGELGTTGLTSVSRLCASSHGRPQDFGKPLEVRYGCPSRLQRNAGGSWGRRRAEECGGRHQVPRPIRNLASIFFPSLLSSPSASLGCTGGRDGLPQHLVLYSLGSLYKLFAALDPLP